MNYLTASMESFQGLSSSGEAPLGLEDYLMRLFYLLCGVGGLVIGAIRWHKARADEEAGQSRPTPTVAPAEVAGLVGRLAQEILGIGPEQLNESMEDLRIPRGDYLGFLDELEEEHDLPVPAPARAMSMSISGVVAAICAEF